VTRPAKPANPSVKAGGVRIFSSSARGPEPGRPGSGKRAPCGHGVKRAASKPGNVADQIGEHLRSIYDDVLNQPVPARFLELLQKLENASALAPGKDGK
jgi:hypothetical protein